MNNPKFEIGQHVIHSRTGRRLQVLQRRYNKPITTIAFVTREDGTIDRKLVTLSDCWAYKLSDGKAIYYWENTLESPHS